MVITFHNDGSLLLGNDRVKMADLSGLLRDHQAKHPGFPLLIRGDARSSYQTVMDVLDIAAAAGIKQIGLPTEPRK